MNEPDNNQTEGAGRLPDASCSADNRVLLEISGLDFELLAECFTRANWPWAGVLEALAIGGARWTPAGIPNAARIRGAVQRMQEKTGEWVNSGGLTVFPNGTMKLDPCLSAHWRTLAPNVKSAGTDASEIAP